MSEQELRDALWQLHAMQHDSEEDDIWCESCGVIWPCPTVKVLREGEDVPDDVMHARREEEAWAAAAYRAASALPEKPGAVNPMAFMTALPCSRYFGSDGTLCATHNGRFTADAMNRCNRAALAATSREASDE